MARLVRCPKCRKILTEFADIPVYQCGECATILRAKNHKAPGEDANMAKPPINHQESMSEHGFSDSGSTSAKEIIPSSSSPPSLKVSNEGEISVLIANSNQDNEGEILELTNEQTETGGFSSSQSLEVSQSNKESSLIEQADIDSMINELASGSLKLTEDDGRVSDPLGPGDTSEEDIVGANKNGGLVDSLKSSTTISSRAYEGGISSSDDGSKGHVHDQSIPKSRRTFRNHFDKSKGKEKEEEVSGCHKRSEIHSGSLSGSSDGTDDSDVFKIFNELRKEISSKYKSVGIDRSFDSMEYQSAKSWLELEKDEQSRALISDEELLMKIDELRDALAKFVHRKGTKFSHKSRYDRHRVDQQPKANLLHHARVVSYGQPSNASDQSWPSSFLGSAPCSCLHCQEERHKKFRFNASNVSSSSSPGGSLHGSEKSSVREKPKRHCRPISRAAPFVICYNCMTLLQLPSDFLISRKKLHKLKCDACKEVLMLTFPGRTHSTPQTPDQVIHSSGKAGEIASGSATLSEVKGKGPARLHCLMGYGSARELLYSRNDIHEGFVFSVSPSLQSHIPSYGSPVKDKAQGSGSSTSTP